MAEQWVTIDFIEKKDFFHIIQNSLYKEGEN